MAAGTPQPIVFLVPGTSVEAEATVRRAAAAPVPAGLLRGRIKQSVRIAAQRAAGVETRVEAIPGEDVVVLHIADGPSLVLHPETARDLMLAQGEPKQDRGARGAPIRLFPFSRRPDRSSEQPQVIAIDPRIAFGRPVVAKAGVRTDVIFDRFGAGDSPTEVAGDYGVGESAIFEALRYEQSLAAWRPGAVGIDRGSMTLPATFGSTIRASTPWR
jgi:uncharacterized protein (DUF433 family)